VSLPFIDRRLRAVPAVALAVAWIASSRAAQAYRPFTGTDAEVAAPGDFELELGPVNWYSQGGSHYLIAPATVLNLGYLPGWELVADFQNYVGIDIPPGAPHDRLLDTDILTKVVLLPGVLQGAGRGPSIALEVGPLLPNVNGDDGFGASADLIVSERFGDTIFHVNSWFLLTRGDLHPDWFEGVIVEGNADARVRPVGEAFVEHEFVTNVTSISGLVGGIWRAREGLDLDVGLREAAVARQLVSEVRLGLTWTFAVWHTGVPPR
jgi:hypothetical protein